MTGPVLVRAPGATEEERAVYDWTVANQKKSGRCWLFAALNLFRFGTREVLGVKQFEFSQNHAMFWDKLERVNYFLADVVATAERPVDGRLVSFLLKEVIGDGGQWNMATNVFTKHGVVPKEAMPETESSGNTAVLNRTAIGANRSINASYAMPRTYGIRAGVKF